VRIGRSGQQAVELALLLPAFLLVISGGIDLGMAWQRSLSAGMAAEEAAKLLASQLAERQVLDDTAPLPGWAAGFARSVALARGSALDPAETSVEARWDGPGQAVVRRYRPYRFRVTVPYAPNEEQDVDLSHDHGFGYWQPGISRALVRDTYGVGASVTESYATFGWSTVNFPHSHSYVDAHNPTVPYNAYPWGWTTGFLWLPPFGFGWGGGTFTPFRVIAAATPIWWPSLLLRSTFVDDAPNPVMTRTGEAWAMRPVSGSVTVDDWNNVQGPRQDLRGVFDRADTELQRVGPYAVLRGTREFVVETDEGPSEAVFARPLVVTVRTRIRALTPLLGPFLDGRVVERTARVTVRWERGW
jgi:hypothetical protein